MNCGPVELSKHGLGMRQAVWQPVVRHMVMRHVLHMCTSFVIGTDIGGSAEQGRLMNIRKLDYHNLSLALLQVTQSKLVIHHRCWGPIPEAFYSCGIVQALARPPLRAG